MSKPDPGKLKVLLDQVAYYIQDEAKAHKEYRALAARFKELGLYGDADKIDRVADQEREHSITLINIRPMLMTLLDEALR